MLVNYIQVIAFITGESALVFRGHIVGGELVAVKTVKGKGLQVNEKSCRLRMAIYM